MKSLEAHIGDCSIVSNLAKHTKSDSDHMALFVLFKVNYSVQIQDHQASKLANESKETLDTLSSVPEYIGGRLLQGLLLTKKIQEQLKIRCDLLSWPTDIPLIRELPLNTLIKVFSSKFEEDNFKMAMSVLGYSMTSSLSTMPDGDIAMLPPISSILKESLEPVETYASTVKYSMIPVTQFLFEPTDLKLSEDSKHALKSVLSTYQTHGEVNKEVQNSCENFFELFGSHANLGPFTLGGYVLWTCTSRGFNENERAIILKMQEDIISIAEIKFSGNKSKDEYTKKNFKYNLANTYLARDVIGGLKETYSLSQSNELADNYVVIDKGTRKLGVWDIVELNYEQEYGVLAEPLKQSWEMKTGLKTNLDLMEQIMYAPDYILVQLNKWNTEISKTYQFVHSSVKYLLKVKYYVQETSKSWITEYLSQPAMHVFLLSTASLSLDQTIISDIQDLVTISELKQLQEQGHAKTELLFEWLYKANKKSYTQKAVFDFNDFLEVLRSLIDDSDLSSVPSFQDTFSTKITDAITSLRFQYQQTYEDVLIVILIHHFQCGSAIQNITPQPLSPNFIIEELLITFPYYLSLFKTYQKKSHSHLQSYLLILAIKTVRESELKDFLKEVSDLMQGVEPPLVEQLSSKLDQYLHGETISELFACLKSFINWDDLDITTSQSNIIPHVPNSSNLKIVTAGEEEKVLHYSSCNKDQDTILDVLGLSATNKLHVKDALCIRSEVMEWLSQGFCTNPKQLPHLVLYKLMSYDTSCRSDLLRRVEQDTGMASSVNSIYDTDDDDDDDDDDEIRNKDGFEGIHPVDCLLALLICSDDFCGGIYAAAAACYTRHTHTQHRHPPTWCNLVCCHQSVV